MYFTTQPGGLYGSQIGNIAGVDLPFGDGGNYKTIQQQFRPGSRDRQRIPDPIRIFPQNEPGREGAINIRFEQAQALPGMPPMGNAGAGFTPSFQNPVVIPDGFQQQLDQMEEETRKQQLQRFMTLPPTPYPQRYF